MLEQGAATEAVVRELQDLEDLEHMVGQEGMVEQEVMAVAVDLQAPMVESVQLDHMGMRLVLLIMFKNSSEMLILKRNLWRK